MLDLDYPRDLLMTGAIFGVVTFVWSGWAQERPPKHWGWRVLLAALGLGGLVLAGLSIPAVIRNWQQPTAIEFGGPQWTVYIVICIIEAVVIAVGAILAARAGRSDLIAPLALAVVGIHFYPLASVFAQPILYVVATLVTIAAIVAVVPKTDRAARSFWCGVLAAPVFLAAGTVSYLGAVQALAA